MQIVLSSDIEKIINSKIASGVYSSVDDVIRQAIYLLDDRDEFQSLIKDGINEKIEKGLKDFEEGRYYTQEELESSLDAVIISAEEKRG
jgi:antitoxin ParD1/3/4